MNQATELIAQQYADAAVNKKVWSDFMYNVKVYGAKGDGITDDSTAIKQALTAAAVTGGTVIFSPGTYKLDIPIDVTISNVELVGNGATIDCRGTRDQPGINGQGGGITINGNKNNFRGLTVVGFVAAQNSTLYGFGELLHINGNLNKVVECFFKDGNGGAVYLDGDNNTVSDCHFDKCNNYEINGAHYGCIQVLSGTGNVIRHCWMIDQYYSGVTLIGNISKTKIEGCYIRATNPLNIDTSMGIYAFGGSCRDLDIIGCTIENVSAECLALFSDVTYPSDAINISNNTFRNYAQTGVAIYKGNAPGAKSTNVNIEGNLFIVTAGSPGMHIYTALLEDSVIRDNIIKGSASGVGTVGTGIYVGDSPANNTIEGNNISHVNIGIDFADNAGGSCSSNTIRLCSFGIDYGFCNRARICDNNLIGCTTALNKGPTNGDFAFLSGNMVSGHTTASNAVLLYGDVQTTIGATLPYKTGTLVAGSAAITFFNIDSGDAFIVIPTSYAAEANCGALYIAAQEYSNDRMVIKSTNTADTRNFIVIKVASGVV